MGADAETTVVVTEKKKNPETMEELFQRLGITKKPQIGMTLATDDLKRVWELLTPVQVALSAVRKAIAEETLSSSGEQSKFLVFLEAVHTDLSREEDRIKGFIRAHSPCPARKGVPSRKK